MKYNQKLPQNVEAALDAYIERIKAIKWFKPDPTLERKTVDTAVKAALSAFGVEASIEYRSLKTESDYDAARDAARDAAWDAAWGAARDAARDAAWDAAWGAHDTLATFTGTYTKATPFLRLVDLWELGMYPVGVVNGKFIVYSPIDFEAAPEEKELEVFINGVKYVRAV